VTARRSRLSRLHDWTFALCFIVQFLHDQVSESACGHSSAVAKPNFLNAFAIRIGPTQPTILHAALDAGYNSPSAFISMFRQTMDEIRSEMGTSPHRRDTVGGGERTIA